MQENIGIVTRFYGLKEDDTRRLAAWVDAALKIVSPERIFVAIRSEVDLAGSYDFMQKNYPQVNVFSVIPWGKVVQAPNALLMKCTEKELTYILFVSTEYPVTQSIVSLLQSKYDDKTLVVGAYLAGHEMKASSGEQVVIHRANGLQIPWNTYALWSVERLIHTGFVLAADSLYDPDNAGMEEMGTIAAQQILWPGKAMAKLVTPPAGELISNTHGWNIKRHDRYMKNLQSKNARALAQLERLSLPPPDVLHIG